MGWYRSWLLNFLALRFPKPKLLTLSKSLFNKCENVIYSLNQTNIPQLMLPVTRAKSTMRTWPRGGRFDFFRLLLLSLCSALWATFTNFALTGAASPSAQPSILSAPMLDHSSDGHSIVLGEGTFGTVSLVRSSGNHTSSSLVAIKTFSTTDAISAIHREASIALSLQHSNVMHTYALQSRHNKTHLTYQLVMEYLPVSFLSHVKTIKTSRTALFRFFKDICQGVAYMHNRGLAHLDMKPENVLVSASGTPKIIDFGSAEIVRSPLLSDPHSCVHGAHQVFTHGIGGSEPYMPPEVYGEDKYDAQKADVWALGITFVQMFLDDYSQPWAFSAMEDEDFARYVNTNSLGYGERGQNTSDYESVQDRSLLRYLPRESRDMVGRMLSIEPAQRPDVEEIIGSQWLEAID